MFNNILSVGTSSLSFTKILFGISKSLQIAKNIVPIYEQMSPLIKKVPIIMNRISGYKNQLYNMKLPQIDNTVGNTLKKQENPIYINKPNSFGPTFFH